jgi:LEA14-like dessication related protein
MKIQKKYIIAGALGVVSIALALGYLQYRKLMNYKIAFKNIKIKTLSATNIAFDIFLNFTNNSNLKFQIIEQQSKIYINGKFVSDLVNTAVNTIEPTATSVIGTNVSFNPTSVLSSLNKSFASILLNPASVIVKVDLKMKVKLYGIKISIPFVFEDTLKAIIDMAKAPKEV